MNLRRLTATAVLVIAALGVGAGTSFAQPTPATPQGVDYVTQLVGKSVVTTLKGGTFQVKKDGKSVDIKDAAGHALVTLPLTFKLDNASQPLAHQVSNNDTRLALTPPANLKPNGMPIYVKPVASLEENQKAQTAFATQLGLATAIGGLIGTGIGAVIGAIVFAPAALTIALIPAWLGGIAAGAGIGGIVGTLVAGGPTLLIAGVDLVQTMIAPPGTTKWYNPKTDAH